MFPEACELTLNKYIPYDSLLQVKGEYEWKFYPFYPMRVTVSGDVGAAHSA